MDIVEEGQLRWEFVCCIEKLVITFNLSETPIDNAFSIVIDCGSRGMQDNVRFFEIQKLQTLHTGFV